MFTVSLFGHRHIDDFKLIEGKIEEVIDCLLKDNKEITFLVGKEGDFDWLASSIIRQKKKIFTNIRLVLVLPYVTSEYVNNYE